MLENIWQAFLEIVRQEIGSRVVETWLKAVTLVKWDSLNKVIHLQAPNAFVRDWIKSQYLELFKLHLGRLLNVDTLTIVFIEHAQNHASRVQDSRNMKNKM